MRERRAGNGNANAFSNFTPSTALSYIGNSFKHMYLYRKNRGRVRHVDG